MVRKRKKIILLEKKKDENGNVITYNVENGEPYIVALNIDFVIDNIDKKSIKESIKQSETSPHERKVIDFTLFDGHLKRSFRMFLWWGGYSKLFGKYIKYFILENDTYRYKDYFRFRKRIIGIE